MDNKNKGGRIIRCDGHHHAPKIDTQLEELGMRQLFDEETNSLTYLIWDKQTEDAIIIDPVSGQASRDERVSTNLNLLYAINTHVHEDHVSGNRALKKKVKGLQSVISRASGADADEFIDDGDEIHFGSRHVVALATPGHTAGDVCFLLDDGKAVLTGDTLLVGGPGPVLEGGSAWSLCDSIFHKLFTLPEDCVVLPGHDYGGGLHSTIGKEMRSLTPKVGNTMEDFTSYANSSERKGFVAPGRETSIAFHANMKDGAKPFHLHSLRTRAKHRWGIFG